ncbi:MAG: 16S rRNA (adenine(1518)-N(6)/adenine(1519)-N(6))-dimethyltransferase RsmA, partial [Dehalococcoidia bacterium]|nr:16S rRNA (adenine(1518)-N(6)/adenine(1519)-N(6))-dimethyltransferase RsmA [Dehalococcoidia bacterium]
MTPSDDRVGHVADLARARALLERHGLVAKKRLSQNFLVNRGVLQRIVRAAAIEPHETVIEVGPGLGVLTRELALRAHRVFAIEIDRQLVAVLQETVAHTPNVTIVHADVLQTDPATLAGGPYVVVANLPYAITSAALRHFLEADRQPDRLVVMVQKEVAQRIVARPGRLSLLGVSVQVYGAPRIVAEVSPGSFYPAPEVASAIVRIDVRPEPLIRLAERDHFFRVVSAGFSHPRKQLHNALQQGMWFPPGG